MKKTILATLIASASFGATAAPTPVEPIHGSGEQYVKVLNTVVDRVNQEDITYIPVTGEVEVKAGSIEFSVNDSGELYVSYEDLDGNAYDNPISTYEESNEFADYIKEDIIDVVKATHENARQERQENRDRVIAPIEDMPSIPYTREELSVMAVDYLQNTNVLENGNLDKIAKVRLNNENKVEFTNEQKFKALNKIAAKGEHSVDGVDRFAMDKDGNIVDTSTGMQIKQDVIDAYVADAHSKIQQEAQKRAEENAPIDLPPVNDPIKQPVIEPDNEKVAEAVKNLIDSGEELANAGQVAKAQGQAQAAQQQAQIDEIYAQGQTNANDIATLFNEVDRLDTRIDQTQALNAATVNARPMVTNGQTAFGAGVGYAGSEAAISVGVAHSFVDTGWSASGTLAASSDDVVIGAGTQYAF